MLEINSYFLFRLFARNSLSLPQGGLEQGAIQSKAQLSVYALIEYILEMTCISMSPQYILTGLFRWQAASDNFYETDTEFEFENITTGIISKIKLIELVKLVIIFIEPCICCK